MVDGQRKRRFSANRARRAWYAFSRSARFSRRFGFCESLEPGREPQWLGRSRGATSSS